MAETVVDANELEARIRQLSKTGLKDGQLWRAVYTRADGEAKALVGRWMTEAGLAVREDAVGNLFGRVDPSARDALAEKVVMAGSHLDTVRNGGAYDGAVGVICAIAAVSSLLRRFGPPRVPVEVAALCEEEGSRYAPGYLGSRAIAEGLAERDLASTDEDGVTLREAMLGAGLDPDRAGSASRSDIGAFIELHIEQGPILERSGVAVGIVENITGLALWTIEVKGRADHAGTTPMDLRLDALVGAARFLAELPAVALGVSPQARATVGIISAEPGATNVVPEKVKVTVDVRDVDDRRLHELETAVAGKARELRASGYEVAANRLFREAPVSLDPHLIRTAQEAATSRGVAWLCMNSGAGHDAQVLSRIAPAVLLFTPCRAGRSHCPEEFAASRDLAVATEVLHDLLHQLAWRGRQGP